MIRLVHLCHCVVIKEIKKNVGDLSPNDKLPTIFQIIVPKIVGDLSLIDKSPTIFLIYSFIINRLDYQYSI